MSRRVLLALVAACIALAPMAARAGDGEDYESPENFEYRAQLSGPALVPGIIYSIPLGPEVFNSCRFAGCTDIRVFGPGGLEVPFALLRNKKVRRRTTHDFEVIGFKSEDDGSSVVEFRHSHGAPKVTRIIMDVADSNFRRVAELYAMGEGGQWVLIKKDEIFDFGSEVPLRRTAIDTGGTAFARYRLVLSAHKGPAGEGTDGKGMELSYGDLRFHAQGTGFSRRPLKISGIRGESVLDTGPGSYEHSPLDGLSWEMDDRGNSVAQFSSNLPFEKIELDITTPYFYRAVRLYHSASSKGDSFITLATGEVHRFPLSVGTENRLYLNVPRVGSGHYRLAIENRGNPPLVVNGAMLTWASGELFFTPSKGGEAGDYWLYTGNQHMGAHKQYDMSRFINDESISRMQHLRLDLPIPGHWAGYDPRGVDGSGAKMEMLILRAVVISLVIGLVIWLVILTKKGTAARQ